MRAVFAAARVNARRLQLLFRSGEEIALECRGWLRVKLIGAGTTCGCTGQIAFAQADCAYSMGMPPLQALLPMPSSSCTRM